MNRITDLRVYPQYGEPDMISSSASYETAHLLKVIPLLEDNVPMRYTYAGVTDRKGGYM